MELKIEQFSPKKAELELVANKYKNLSIENIEDTTGYKLVDEARKDLKRKRVEIQKTGKELRDEANKFAKSVIGLEKELIGIISPIEEELKDKQFKIDLEKQRQERLILLPERKEKLEEVRVVGDVFVFTMPTDDELLLMSPENFNIYYNEKKSEYLQEKEEKLAKEEEYIRVKKVEAELEEQRLKDLEKAREEAKLQAEKEAKDREERFKKEAEETKQKAIEEERRKAQEEKQRIIDEQRTKEEERIAKEKEDKEAKEAKEKKEKEEKEKMEKRKAFVQWLKDNGYNEKNKDDFYRIDTDKESILYKKISVFKIK